MCPHLELHWSNFMAVYNVHAHQVKQNEQELKAIFFFTFLFPINFKASTPVISIIWYMLSLSFLNGTEQDYKVWNTLVCGLD